MRRRKGGGAAAALSLSATLVAIAEPARADFQLDIVLLENNIPVTPGVNSTAFTWDCEFGLPNPTRFGGLDLTFSGSTSGSYNVGITASHPTTLDELAATAIRNRLSDSIRSIPCGLGVEETIAVVSGNVFLDSSILLGPIFGPPARFSRKSTGSIVWNDVLEIRSPVPLSLEMPVHVGGSITAVEFGGDPARTTAKATLRMNGALGPEGVNESITVESVSAIPEQGEIHVNRVVPVTVAGGVTGVPVSITSFVEAEATALTPTVIAVRAQISVDFPDSIRIGRLRLAGGGPLPAGFEVRLASNGLVIQRGAGCPADFNQDGFLDFFDFDDFVTCFEGGACPPGTSADFNGDGFTDFFDFDDFIAAFETGC